MTRTLNEKQSKLIKELANDFSETVKTIEKGLKTTQNNYGRYGQLLSMLSKGNRKHAEIYALALIEAGANIIGVKNALKCFC
tara:strand:+ start:846 stop:1091 length:246 start_codon:yes stop_codon:yes gene_type:complete